MPKSMEYSISRTIGEDYGHLTVSNPDRWFCLVLDMYGLWPFSTRQGSISVDVSTSILEEIDSWYHQGFM